MTRRRMALVVFLRGVNVGGHRTFRPSVLARELGDYDVVNVGAAGTFVVRQQQIIKFWQKTHRYGCVSIRDGHVGHVKQFALCVVAIGDEF